MPKILNRSDETWDFGPLRVPPGYSDHSLGDVQEAATQTRFAQVVVMSGSPQAMAAKFVLLIAGVSTYGELASAQPPTAVPEAVPPPSSDLPDAEPDPDGVREMGETLSRKELRDMASELGVEGAQKMLKTELLDVLSSI